MSNTGRDDIEAGIRHNRSDGDLVEQSRLLDLIFDHTLDCVALMDGDFNFIRVSESYARACGRNLSDFTGWNHFDMFPSPLEDEVRPFVRDRRIYSRRDRPFVFPDHPEWGTTYWDLTLVPILDAEGEVDLLLLTLKDTTKRKRAEDALKGSEARLSAIANTIPYGLQECDLSGIITYSNPAHARILGYDDGELVGRSIWSVYDTEDERETLRVASYR